MQLFIATKLHVTLTVRLLKTFKPSFNGAGVSWNLHEVFIDEVRYIGYTDTKHGLFLYVKIGDDWYKTRIRTKELNMEIIDLSKKVELYTNRECLIKKAIDNENKSNKS